MGHQDIRFSTTFSGQDFETNKWLATCTHVDKSNNSRSLIVNNRTHEVCVLDGSASSLWNMIVEGATHSDLQQHAARNGFNEQDLSSFISELIDADLITSTKESDAESVTVIAPPSVSDTSLEDENSNEWIEVEAEYRNWCAENGFLFSAFVETNYRCNERCVHCFNPGAAHQDHERPQRNRDELSFEELCDQIDAFYDLGAFRITLSGGEFFIRKDALAIIEYIRSKKMDVEVFTNGLLLTEAKADQLASLWPHEVGMSLYSANPIIHDQITRVPGSWEQTIEAVRRLVSRGITVKIKCAVMKSNAKGYALVRDLAASLGAKVSFDIQISAGNDGAAHPLSLNVDDFGELVVLAMTEGSPLDITGMDQVGSKNNQLRLGHVCGAGTFALSLTPDGDILPCSALPHKLGNVRDGSGDELKRIWMHSTVGRSNTKSSDELPFSEVWGGLSTWQGLKFEDTEECGTHSRCHFCNRCVGGSLSAKGDALKPMENQCKQASARLEASKALSAGMTREDVCAHYGVSTNFGRLFE